MDLVNFFPIFFMVLSLPFIAFGDAYFSRNWDEDENKFLRKASFKQYLFYCAWETMFFCFGYLFAIIWVGL